MTEAEKKKEGYRIGARRDLLKSAAQRLKRLNWTGKGPCVGFCAHCAHFDIALVGSIHLQREKCDTEGLIEKYNTEGSEEDLIDDSEREVLF